MHGLWNEGPGQPHGYVPLNDTGDCVPQIGPQSTLLPPFFPGKTRPGMPFISPLTISEAVFCGDCSEKGGWEGGT